ncbi:MAG TPA: acetaldehyde dehydrogenase (acetylating) [Streptosporangiaceae bacterium]
MATRCAIMGSGNIGTDLMIKLMRSDALELVALVGIDAASDGLARARDLGIEAPHTGIDWVREHADEIDLVFDATSAYVHVRNAGLLADLGIAAIDLTPAARGPKVVPTVNLSEHLDAPNVNMITCGGQATTPIVAAVSRVTTVPYAEMVSAVASRSAGPGTRQNIDEFTRTTARALEEIGGAAKGKAIIILNPADPPILMRNTVFCALPDGTDHDAVIASVEAMVADVASYVPGYRLKNRPVIEEGPFNSPGGPVPHRVVVLLEVEGAGDYLPTFAGNLDIMTAAAVAVGEAKAAHLRGDPGGRPSGLAQAEVAA